MQNKYKPDELLFDVGDSEASDVEIIRKLRNAQQTGEILSGYCTKAQADGTLVIKLTNNINGYIPREEVTYRVEDDGLVHLGKCQSRVALVIQFKVKDIKEAEDGSLVPILSRKMAVEEIRDYYEKNLKPGVVVRGVVIGIQPFGAFIDIGGDVTGLIPVADVTRVYLEDVSEVLQVGQAVTVVVKEIEDENGRMRITFSRKELLPDWDKIDDLYRSGETVIGTVKKMIDTGMFVQLDESFEGLADFVPGRNYEYGEKVRVKIIEINKDKKRIRLRII